MIKVSDFIAEYLKKQYHINHIFLISGGGAMHLNDSFGKLIPYTTAHHEQALSMMAEGFARYNNRLAVVNITAGPGGLNCLNGLFGQWTDSVPVLYISGQVKYTTTLASCPTLNLRQLGDQEVDIISVVKPLTKYQKMVSDPLSIKYHIDQAVYLATHGRMGPVWLDIPLDVQGAMIDMSQLQEFTAPDPIIFHDFSDKIIQQLQLAKRPLLVVGHGVRLSNQLDTFHQLLNKINIPVVTTLNGVDILDEEVPNYIGRIGTIGHRAGNFALQNADCILFLGTRNNIRQISYNYENFAKNAYKIVVDIDQSELDKPTFIPDLKIHADLAILLPSLLKKNISITCTDWLQWCQQRKDKFSFSNTKEYQQNDSKINPYYFVHQLSQKTADTIVTANSSACVITYQTAHNKKNQRWIWNSGSAAMGYALPASIGVYWNSKKPVICLEGDGSIMMNIQELQTIKHYTLPIKVFILNNKGYISIIQTQNNFFDGRMVDSTKESGFSTPDFCKIAEAFGLPTVKISDPNNLQQQIQQVLDMEGPVVCEVIIDDKYTFTPKLSTRTLEDGTMVSSSLEDMYPFLDRDEYNKNMISE